MNQGILKASKIVRSMQWSIEMATGHQAIDEQHQHLMDIIFSLSTALSAKLGTATLLDIMAQLRAYAKEHFALEESILAAGHIDDWQEHLESHREFLILMDKNTQKIQQGDLNVAYTMLNYLNNWLKGHIMKSDLKHAELFKRAASAENLQSKYA
jgi:hemerythrin-like metal-binding protein